MSHASDRRSVRPLSCAAVIAALSVAVACGGGSRLPGGPSGSSSIGRLSGVVVRVLDGSPIAGATVRSGARSVVTGADGAFSIDARLGVGSALSFSAPGFIERAASFSATRANLRVDLIPDSAPFSLQFYREFVRNGFEAPNSLFEIRRWTIAPSFYIQTSVVENGAAVPEAIVDRVAAVIRGSVPELSNGAFEAAAIERGPEARPPQGGWVRVAFFLRLDSGAIGRATVGGNSGIIDLVFDPANPQPASGVTADCGDRMVAAAEHELAHTMGFWHTFNQTPDFRSMPGTGCTGAPRPAHVRYHAAIAYSRVPGNRDVDVDPLDQLGLAAPQAVTPLVVSCSASAIR